MMPVTQVTDMSVNVPEFLTERLVSLVTRENSVRYSEFSCFAPSCPRDSDLRPQKEPLQDHAAYSF